MGMNWHNKKLKAWIIHKLGGITLGETLPPVQITRTEVPVHTFRCKLILREGMPDWMLYERNRRLSEMIASKLIEADMLEIRTEPTLFEEEEIVTATVRVLPPLK